MVSADEFWGWSQARQRWWLRHRAARLVYVAAADHALLIRLALYLWALATQPIKMTVQKGSGQAANDAQGVPGPRHETWPGETLAGVALRQLGDESRWGEIKDLNPDACIHMGRHDYLRPGTMLQLPKDTPAAAHSESDD